MDKHVNYSMITIVCEDCKQKFEHFARLHNGQRKTCDICRDRRISVKKKRYYINKIRG